MTEGIDWRDQVFYQIFVRSFRDGNGDGVGDFAGIVDRLDYLSDLGVTALWLNPIFPSASHHNYFTTDFFATDPEYGTLEEFADLCQAVHARGMRLFIDMETQYVSREHAWFVDADANPESEYSNYFLFQGAGNTDPVFLSMDYEWDDEVRRVDLPDFITLNLKDPEVVAFHHRLYRHWLDPLANGDRACGVDGFRLDHAMDDLDDKGVLTGLNRGFWRPLIDYARGLDENVFFVGEPADWHDSGGDLMAETDMDGVFAIPLMFALRTFDKKRVADAVDRTVAAATPGKHPFLILENHDVTRYATAVHEHPGKERAGAALLMTLPGVPNLYYGQEIGMIGEIGGSLRDFHMPAREAFRWRNDHDVNGMATWYRHRDFWRHRTLEREDGRDLESQQHDDDSLYNWYRRLIALRHASAALRNGDLQFVTAGCDNVLAYRRSCPAQTVLVLVNLADEPARLEPDLGDATVGAGVFGEGQDDTGAFTLSPYGVCVTELNR